MKLRSGNIKYNLFLLILIFSTRTLIFSQDSIIVETNRTKLYLGISMGPSKNQIINEVTPAIKEISSGSRNSFSGSFELGYLFSKCTGISTGLDYESYSTELSLKSYSSSYNITDPENETYERRISATNIKEIQKISFLSVPLCLNFQIPFGKRFGFYIHAGINLSFPLRSEYGSSGTFTFSGYFPAYNIVLANLPEYGFPSDSKILSGGKLDLKSDIIDGIGAAGFQLFLSRKIQIAIGVDYKRSLSNISKYNSPDKFQLSSDVNQINSMMGGISNALAETMGLKLSFRYYLK